MNVTAEVAGLIETLHKAEARLEELTEGEVDSVMNLAGRTFLLRPAQEQLQRSEAAKQAVILRLEAVNETLETFSYSVSHDLRAPLRHIMAFAEVLQQEAGPSLTLEHFNYLTAISRSAKRMGDLIDALLTFSRTGRVELQTTRVDTGQLVKDVLEDFQAETTARNIAWTLHPLPSVQADQALLRMVLVNLISNAVKFSGARADSKIEIGCMASENDEAILFIRDNGVGFDEKYAGKLFGVFQRLHGQSEFEGTGIGLANVQRIVNRHGGRAWAQGVVGEGATFCFSLPKRG